MITDNALDPPPARRRPGRVPYPRIAAGIAGVVVAGVAIYAIAHMVLHRPDAQGPAGPAGFARAGAASSSQTQPPPAVTPQAAAQDRANLDALQRAANAPGLGAQHVQVSAVSPPGGSVPSGVGVSRSSASVGPSDG